MSLCHLLLADGDGEANALPESRRTVITVKPPRALATFQLHSRHSQGDLQKVECDLLELMILASGLFELPESFGCGLSISFGYCCTIYT